MPTLTQDQAGKWRIKNLRHDKEGVSIPAKFTYSGSSVTFNINYTSTIVETDWKTQIGVPLNLNEVQRVYSSVTIDNKTYEVIPGTEQFNVYPASSSTSYKLEIEPTSFSLSVGSTQQLTAWLTTYINGEQQGDREDVTTLTTWASNNESVATISNAGLVTARGEGDGSVKGTCKGKTVTVNVSVAAGAYFNFGVTSPVYYCETGASSQVIPVTSNTGWTLSSDQSWVTINSSASGTGNGSFSINVSSWSNTTTHNERQATITATYGNGLTKTMTVIQEVAAVTRSLSLAIPKETLEYGETTQATTTLQVIRNYGGSDHVETSEDVTEYCTWHSTNTAAATVSTASGTRGLVTGKNTGENAKTTRIQATYTYNSDDIVAEKQITGAAYDDQFNVSPSAFTFPYAGGSQILQINNPQDHHWIISGAPSWLTFEVTEGFETDGVDITAATRTDGSQTDRSGMFTVKDLTTNKEYGIGVSQKGQQQSTFSVSPQALNFAYSGGTGLINIDDRQGHHWEITAPSWILLEDTQGDDSAGVSVVVCARTDSDSNVRTGTITVRDTDTATDYPVFVAQDSRPVIPITVSPSALTFPYTGGTQTLEIYNPQEHHWSAITVPEWIHMDNTFGEDTDNVGVVADGRTDSGSSPYEATIILKDTTTNQEHSINVTQEPICDTYFTFHINIQNPQALSAGDLSVTMTGFTNGVYCGDYSHRFSTVNYEDNSEFHVVLEDPDSTTIRLLIELHWNEDVFQGKRAAIDIDYNQDIPAQVKDMSIPFEFMFDFKDGIMCEMTIVPDYV